MKRKLVDTPQSGSKNGATTTTTASATTSATTETGKDMSQSEKEEQFLQACFCNFFQACGKPPSVPFNKSTSRSTTESLSATDAALVQELNNLSIAERQRVYEDVHGISDTIEETPQLVSLAVAAVNAELKKKSTNKAVVEQKKVYAKATFLRPNYFQSTPFVVHFLRAQEFDMKKAAQRILDHLQLKFELFGYEGLSQKAIQYDKHLTDGAKRYLATGRIQLLRNPDQSGRPVLVVFPKKQATNYHFNDGIIAYWWIFEIAKQQFEQATKKGMVFILYDSQIVASSTQQAQLMKKYYFDIEGLKAATRFVSSTSLTLSAFHFCYDNPKLAAPMSTFQAVIGQHGRVRFRAHCESPTESLYTLMTFGIDTRDFPVDQQNQVKMDEFYKWIGNQRQLEEQQRESDADVEYLIPGGNNAVVLVRYPRSNDVVLGRGKPFQEHPGNQHMANMVNEKWELYQNSTLKGKMDLTMQIVETIKSQGYKFLRRLDKDMARDVPEDYGWIVVRDSKAREKVSHGFRNNTIQRKGNYGTILQKLKPPGTGTIHDNHRSNETHKNGPETGMVLSAPSSASSCYNTAADATIANGASVVSKEDFDALDLLNDSFGEV